MRHFLSVQNIITTIIAIMSLTFTYFSYTNSTKKVDLKHALSSKTFLKDYTNISPITETTLMISNQGDLLAKNYSGTLESDTPKKAIHIKEFFAESNTRKNLRGIQIYLSEDRTKLKLEAAQFLTDEIITIKLLTDYMPSNLSYYAESETANSTRVSINSLSPFTPKDLNSVLTIILSSILILFLSFSIWFLKYMVNILKIKEKKINELEAKYFESISNSQQTHAVNKFTVNCKQK